MPYITQRRRDKIDDTDSAYNAGELNYILTKELMSYLNSKGRSYKTINDVLGALEGAKLEFYRRVAVPYEKKKMRDNGDVYQEEDYYGTD